MYKHQLLVVVLALLLIPNVATAGQVFWTFQDTEYPGYGTALAMRNGLAWPVIFTDEGDALSLFPAPDPWTGSNWHQIGTGLFSMGGRIRAASSPDGKVLVASSGGGGQASALPYGWIPLGGSTVAAAFDSQGTLYTATDDYVPGFPGYPGMGGNIVDIAVSVNGDVGVIDEWMTYYQYIPWTNSWSGGEDLMWYGPQLERDSMDLEFDSLGRPHIVGSDNFGLYAFDYDPAGGWSSQFLTGGNQNLALAADSDKLMGTAWVANDTLYYAYKDDLAPWTVGSIFSGGYMGEWQSVGIAYDYNDLPVISFVENNSIWLAYDPVNVPEPVGLTLLVIGGAALLCRRR